MDRSSAGRVTLSDRFYTGHRCVSMAYTEILCLSERGIRISPASSALIMRCRFFRVRQLSGSSLFAYRNCRTDLLPVPIGCRPTQESLTMGDLVRYRSLKMFLNHIFPLRMQK